MKIEKFLRTLSFTGALCPPDLMSALGDSRKEKFPFVPVLYIYKTFINRLRLSSIEKLNGKIAGQIFPDFNNISSIYRTVT